MCTPPCNARRRRDLEALLVGGIDDKGRVLDILCAICEESRWAAGTGGVFEDVAHPDIDLQAADTAALLGWAWHLRGEAFSADGPRVHAWLLQEARRRVLEPLIACEDYLCSTAVYCSAVTALLLLEGDRERLFLALKPLLRCLDAACACAERERPALPGRLTDACALADLAQVVRRISAGAADVTRTVPSTAWLDEILFSHVQEDCTLPAPRVPYALRPRGQPFTAWAVLRRRGAAGAGCGGAPRARRALPHLYRGGCSMFPCAPTWRPTFPPRPGSSTRPWRTAA